MLVEVTLGLIGAVAVAAFFHYLSMRELRRGFDRMQSWFAKMDERFAKTDERFVELMEILTRGFAKMDERFENLMKVTSEQHLKILEAIREASSVSKKSAKGS